MNSTLPICRNTELTFNSKDHCKGGAECGIILPLVLPKDYPIIELFTKYDANIFKNSLPVSQY